MQAEQGEVGAEDTAEPADVGLECPFEEEGYSGEDGVDVAEGWLDDADEDEPEGGGGGFEKASREWIRAERRLCASFSLARFTRLVMSRIASSALLRMSPDVSFQPISVGVSSSSDGSRTGRFLSWSSNNGYLQIRCTGLMR